MSNKPVKYITQWTTASDRNKLGVSSNRNNINNKIGVLSKLSEFPAFGLKFVQKEKILGKNIFILDFCVTGTVVLSEIRQDSIFNLVTTGYKIDFFDMGIYSHLTHAHKNNNIW